MMRSRSTSMLLVATVSAWFVLGCASDPVSENWQAPTPGFAPAGSPVALHGQLAVAGTNLVDSAGTPVQLKGISSMGLNWEIQAFAESKKSLEFMRDNWKVEVIRAAMGVELGQGYSFDPKNMQSRVETIIHHAIDLGVYVIVDWHTEEAVNQQAAAVAFFTTMAKTYGAYPNLIWEPYNEPAGPNPNWYTWAQIKTYHEAVVAAIRGVGANNPIVLGTPIYSQNVDQAALDPVVGKNLLYTLHFYSCTHTQWLRTKADTAIAAGLALFVTEFGATNADGGLAPAHGYVCETEANLWFAWMAQHNISGVAWKLDKCTDASCLLGQGAQVDGPWPDSALSTDVGGAVAGSGAGIQGSQGLFVVNWLRQ